jgi:hypothetical protein
MVVAQADVACLYTGMNHTYQRMREAVSRSYLEASIDDLEKKILSLKDIAGDSFGNPLDARGETNRLKDILRTKLQLQQRKADLRKLS